MNELESAYVEDSMDDFFDDAQDVNPHQDSADFLDSSPGTEPVNVDITDQNTLDDFFDEDGQLLNQEKSAIDLFLESKGFIDSNIPIVDEKGNKSSVPFNELSQEEQLDLLNSFETLPESNFSVNEEEQSFLTEIRKSGMSLEQFLHQYKEEILNDIEYQEVQSYEIDQYDDKSLFLLDLSNRFSNLTEEQLTAELETAMQDEAVFKVKVDALREEYKQYEEEYNRAKEQEFQAQQQQEYQEFSNNMLQIANNVREFHGFELDGEDKNLTLSYLLDLDDQGVSQFYKDLNDPVKLYEVAWYLKNGKDAFSLMEQSYENHISKLTREKKVTPGVVRHNNNNNPQRTISVHELH